MLEKLRVRARLLKRELQAIYRAARDPRTPWYARALIFLVVAYALSPIDLIPDFIPVLGYLDDLVIVPGGIWLAVRLIPPEVLQDARATAARPVDAGMRRLGAALIVLVWIVAGLGVLFLLFLHR